MEEIEYMRATNRAKVTMARHILTDVMQGDDYAVDVPDYRECMRLLGEMEIRLFSSYIVIESKDHP